MNEVREKRADGATVALGFIDHVLDGIVSRPELWGSPEALELQALLALEIRAILIGGDPSRVRKEWRIITSERDPDAGARPHWRRARLPELVAALGKLVASSIDVKTASTR